MGDATHDRNICPILVPIAISTAQGNEQLRVQIALSIRDM